MANVLEVIISGDSKKLDRALNIAEKRLQKVGQKMQSIGKNMSLYVTAPLSLAGAGMIKFASDYNESLNKVDVAFKNSSNSVKEFAKTTLESFGIAEGTALDMASLFGDMATSMGINTSEASKLSTSLVGLAGDLASFKNMNIEEVTTALNGVFTGETESLKRLGVVMTEVNLEQFAMNQGIQKSIKDMTQSEKVMLRYEYVMSKTANAHGDFARTQGGSANQMRIFTEGLKQLGAEFGQTILPFFTKIVSVANSFLKSLSGLGSGTKSLVVGIGALAGAMGPVIYLIGAMKSNWVEGIKTMRNVYDKFKGTLLTNPYVLLAGAVAGVAYAMYKYNKSIDQNLKQQEKLNSLNEQAIDSVASEISQVDRLIGLIKDENVSKEAKKDLLDELHSLNKDYLGDITEEDILTGKVNTKLKEYKDHILDVAKNKAFASEIQKLYQERLKLELTESTTLLNGVEKALYSESKAQELANSRKYVAIQNINMMIEKLKAQIPVSALVTEETKENTEAVGKLTKEEKEFIKASEDKRKQLEKNADVLRKQREDELEDIKKILEANDELEKTKEVKGAEVKFAPITTGVNKKLSEQNEQIRKLTQEQAGIFNEYMSYMQPIAQSIENLFSNLSRSIVDSLASANTGFGAFLSSMASYLLDLGGMILKEIMMIKAQAIALAILNGLKEGSMKGVVGMVAMGGLIAGAIGTINHHFQKSVPKFADGGIVSGPTMAMVGEYSGAKRNPEIIAPLDRLQSMMGGANGNVNVTGEFVVRGQDLVLALQRADQFKNRIS